MKYFDNHFLFSETYIKEYIKENDRNNEKNEQIKNAFIQVKQWNDEYTSGDYQDDPWGDYIDSVLDILGFKKDNKKQERLLYTNTITETENPVAICFTIDKKENISSTDKGKYYAYKAVKAANDHEVEWAMLTNGYRWRIYSTKNVSPYENYLEIDIESSIKNNQEPDEAFKLFYLFFNSTTYYKEDSELIIEKIKEKSDKTAENIEDILRGKAEEILTELCYGLKEDMKKASYTEEDRKNIYNDAIILLYRLLFFGYAESRRLLPVVENDVEYTDSFFKLCQDAKETLNKGEAHTIQSGYEFWESLNNQLRIYVDKTYNGGLFNNIDKPILQEHRIKNKYLLKCLAELSYNKDRNGVYRDKIEYKDLSVRNLGAIYEGVLEYQLFIAEERMVQRKSKGKVKYIRESETTLKNSDLNNLIELGGIYLSQDATERKESGSYYTPEDVVEYIVENTVGKKLVDLKVQLKETLKEYYNQLTYEPTDTGKRRIRNTIDEITKDFIDEKILSLSIIDSAMGSGHFLVNAAYRVANEIVEIISEHDWETELDIVADISYWKRQVVENCIYGIDINGLAVALARLSLWLISASNDKALSFIDHHLKVGDSIIGTDRTKVEMIEDEIRTSIFDVSYERYMQHILSKYKKMNEIGSKTKEDVERQKDVYKEIEKDLELVKRKYDYYLASQYHGGIEDKLKYAELMNAQDMIGFEEEETRQLLLFADQNKFFHWELEFPEVIDKGGFDIAIGNPPYVTDNGEKYKYTVIETAGSGNLYSFMMERGIEHINNSGKYGFIVPISSISGSKFSSLQHLLVNNSSNIFIDSFSTRPSKIFAKVEQRLSILSGERGQKDEECKVYTSGLKRWYSDERKNLFNNKFALSVFHNIKNGSIAKISTEIENEIINKVYSKKNTLKDYYEERNSVDESSPYAVYHASSRYWLKAFNYAPAYYSERRGSTTSTEYKKVYFKLGIESRVIVAILNSSLFYWNWIVFSDERHLTKREIDEFRFEYEDLDKKSVYRLCYLVDELMESYENNAEERTVNLGGQVGLVRYNEYHPKYSKEIIDQIDSVLASCYGFTDEELKYIQNFEIRFRMGRGSEDTDE